MQKATSAYGFGYIHLYSEILSLVFNSKVVVELFKHSYRSDQSITGSGITLPNSNCMVASLMPTLDITRCCVIIKTLNANVSTFTAV